MDRLPADAKELLQMLAITGREFPLSLIYAVVVKSDGELNRLLNDLQLGEFIYEQPATGGIEYIFKRALTQEVAYNSVLMGRRRELHERTAAALETLYASSIEEHLAELAHHYRHSENIAKAVEYLGRTGQQAAQHSAYADAVNHLTAAIDLLQRIPESPERIQRELLLQLTAGPALIATKGRGKEMEQAYTRARELCALLGDPLEELFPVLYGLMAAHLMRGDLRKSYQFGEQLLQGAEGAHDATLLLYARYALGTSANLMGNFLSAREHAEVAIVLYDPELHRPLTARYEGVDAGVLNFWLAALTLWVLGYPEQALKRGGEAIALAERLSHPQSLCRAGMFSGVLHQLFRNVRGVQHAAEGVIALGAEHGITESLPFVTIHRGWALAAQGRHEEGIALIHEGLTMFRAAGVEAVRTSHLNLLAEACVEATRFNDGLSAVTEALAVANENEERFYEAETHRLKGELLLRYDDSQSAEAHSCFERAIEIARQQSAKSWELRATMSLAHLLAKEGHRDEARTMLANIYNWFTEGFDTTDLKNAKQLLAQLAG
jgi:predicted ATPase